MNKKERFPRNYFKVEEPSKVIFCQIIILVETPQIGGYEFQLDLNHLRFDHHKIIKTSKIPFAFIC